MKTLYIMCGVAGSGKSTWVKNNFMKIAGHTAIVSRDKIRFDLVNENEEYFSKEKEVFAQYINLIKDGLENADTVICDATHLNVGSRSKLLRNLGASLKGWKINAIVVRVPLEVALDQNEQRIGTRAYVPPAAVRNMFNSFVMPSFEEGFDKIYVYRPHEYGTKYTIFERENKNEPDICNLGLAFLPR